MYKFFIISFMILSQTWGITINHSEGIEEIFSAVPTNSSINVSGGQITFFGLINNNINFNISGGTIITNTIRNNSKIDITGGTFILNSTIGNNTSVNISNGEIILQTNNNFGDIITSGGILNTNGYDITLSSLTLDGNSFIDLGNIDNSNINLGSIQGTGVLSIINWNDSTRIIFDPGTSTINVSNTICSYRCYD